MGICVDFDGTYEDSDGAVVGSKLGSSVVISKLGVSVGVKDGLLEGIVVSGVVGVCER